MAEGKMNAFSLLLWLLKKDCRKCPRCNYPVTPNNPHCPNCGQPLLWKKKRKKKKKETFWQKIKWKLYLEKLFLEIKLMDLRDSWLKFRHCRKGFHRFKNNYISLTSHRKKRETTIRTDFHECVICGLLIFATDIDKRNWLLIKKQEKGINKKFIEQMLRDMEKKNDKNND